MRRTLLIAGWLAACMCQPVFAQDIFNAVESGNVELARTLLGRDAGLIKARDKYGNNLLRLAILRGDLAMSTMLVAAGAGVNESRADDGSTALHVAAAVGVLDIVKLVAEGGADLKAQDARGDTPLLVAVSGRSSLEHSPVAFSSDLRLVAWSVGNRTDISTIFVMEKRDGRWTAPVPVRSGASHPAFSRDGRRLFYTAVRTLPDSSKAGDDDIFFADRTATGWGPPVSLGPNVNTDQADTSPSVTDDDTLYFEREGEIFRSRVTDGRYGPTEKVAPDGRAIMPFVARDESYLLFKGIGAASPARIAFRRADGTWSASLDIPDTVRTRGTVFPSVTPDGNYFFVATGDVLWTDASFIAGLKARAGIVP